MLARAGAFDQLDPNRRRMLESLDALVLYSEAIHDQRGSAQVSLFGEAGADLPEPRLSPVEDWLPNERLAEEHTAIGFYLSGHPLDDYAGALKRKGCVTLKDLADTAEQNGAAIGKVGVMVSGLQERKSGRGTRFFRLNISDPTMTVSGIAMFTDKFDEMRRVFDSGASVIISLEARFNEGQFDPVARSAAPLDDSVSAGAGDAGLCVYVEDADAVTSVNSLLARFQDDASVKGRGEVTIAPLSVELDVGDGLLPCDLEILLGDNFPVGPRIKSALKSLPGVAMVEET